MKPTKWTVTDRNERVTKVVVQARTQRQLERSRRNVVNPLQPPVSKRRRTS